VDPYAQLEALLELAEQVGLTVRAFPAAADEGDHPGGALASLRGREVLFLNSAAAVTDRLAVAAAALADRPELEERFIPPELRAIIDGRGRADRGGP